MHMLILICISHATALPVHNAFSLVCMFGRMHSSCVCMYYAKVRHVHVLCVSLQTQHKAGFVSVAGASAVEDYSYQIGKDLQKRRSWLFELTLSNQVVYLLQCPNDTQRAQWSVTVMVVVQSYCRLGSVIDLSDLSVICGLWTCHYLFCSNVYIPRLYSYRNCSLIVLYIPLMSVHCIYMYVQYVYTHTCSNSNRK